MGLGRAGAAAVQFGRRVRSAKGVCVQLDIFRANIVARTRRLRNGSSTAMGLRLGDIYQSVRFEFDAEFKRFRQFEHVIRVVVQRAIKRRPVCKLLRKCVQQLRRV